MSACINRWVLLAALAGHAATTWPLAACAQSPDQIQGSAPYALADALMPYAQRDYVRALQLLAPLAEQGNAVAQLKLGIIFSRGKVNSPDHVAALRWFTKAAENGQVEAQFELGRIYRDGLGTRVDRSVLVGARRREEHAPRDQRSR
jgi:TPR repeat protein